jgi:hypothetical protein
MQFFESIFNSLFPQKVSCNDNFDTEFPHDQAYHINHSVRPKRTTPLSIPDSNVEKYQDLITSYLPS